MVTPVSIGLTQAHIAPINLNSITEQTFKIYSLEYKITVLL